MSTSFIFRPHVHEADLVATPDLLIDDVYVTDSGGVDLKISRITNARLCTDPEIQVLGEGTTADAALFLAGAGAGMLIGLASNHRYGLRGDPQIFCKPVCRQVWRFEHVADHWQNLVIQAADYKGIIFQEGELGDFAPVDEIVSQVSRGQSSLVSGTAVICAGLPFRDIGVLERSYSLTLSNPHSRRHLELQYSVRVLKNTN